MGSQRTGRTGTGSPSAASRARSAAPVPFRHQDRRLTVCVSRSRAARIGVRVGTTPGPESSRRTSTPSCGSATTSTSPATLRSGRSARIPWDRSTTSPATAPSTSCTGPTPCSRRVTPRTRSSRCGTTTSSRTTTTASPSPRTRSGPRMRIAPGSSTCRCGRSTAPASIAACRGGGSPRSRSSTPASTATASPTGSRAPTSTPTSVRARCSSRRHCRTAQSSAPPSATGCSNGWVRPRPTVCAGSSSATR